MQPIPPAQPITPLPAGPPKREVPGIVIALGLSVVFCAVVAVGGALFVGSVVLPFLRDPLGALLPPGDAQAKDLAVSADGRWLAVSYGPSIFPEPKVKDYSVQVYDLGRIQTAPLVFRGHNTTAYSVAISADGEWVAAEGDNDTARVWNTRDPAAPPILLPGLEQGNTGLGFSPRGLLLASSNQGIQLWDLAQPALPLATLDPTENADSWVFSADGQTLVISQGRALRRWDLRQPTDPPTVLPEQDRWWNTLAFADEDLLAARHTTAAGTDDWQLEVALVGQAVPTPTVIPLPKQKIGSQVRTVSCNDDLTLSPDGKLLAAACGDGLIRIWTVANLSAAPRTLDYFAFVLAFSPDSQVLVAGGSSEVRLWDLRQPQGKPTIIPAPHVATPTPGRVP
jgi:WD40 repeat protein